MLPFKMKISKKLLPIKAHYFLFNAGTAPLVPYLSTYARQLGFSSTTVGLIYTILPVFGLIAKPLFGVIADRFKIQKSIFIIFQIITIISFSAIYFVPEERSNVAVELDCGSGVTVLRSCFPKQEDIDHCKVTALGNTNETALCHMKCDMSSPKMWQTVCEHWHVPQYCYSSTSSIQYSAHIADVTARDGCAYIASDNVTLDGYSFTPHCRIGNGYVDIKEPCNLTCTDDKLSSVLASHSANMTCSDNLLNYRLCAANLSDLSGTPPRGHCQATCLLEEGAPWRLMEICEGWGADRADTCQPRAGSEPLAGELSFAAVVRLDTAIAEHECVYWQLKHIEMPDGSIHYPNCVSKAQYQLEEELFHSTCEINCNHTMLNEVLLAAHESSTPPTSQFSRQFWLFSAMMAVSWIGQAVVVTFADAICFNLLGEAVSRYGKQRLWGSVGWGIFSLTTGALIDAFSDGAYKNYAVAFVLMFVFMTGDVIVSCFLQVSSTQMSTNILADVGSLLSSARMVVFVLWSVGVGLCTGLLWQFLFWHLEDVAALQCDGSEYIKTLQGLVSAVQTFAGEIPFMFISGYVLKRLGHTHSMSLVLLAFGVRFLLYSWLTNAWWVLPIEIFQGVTFGMFYPTLTSYASVAAPPGTETTVQGLAGAIFEGVGTSLGSLVGGRLYEAHGGWKTFQWFGIGSLLMCGAHVLAQLVLERRNKPSPGYSSVIRFEQPDDTIFIMEEADSS